MSSSHALHMNSCLFLYDMLPKTKIKTLSVHCNDKIFTIVGSHGIVDKSIKVL